MAGLQGSGKTTTSGKLAQWLKKGGHRPMLVSVDVYRPAAREQLKVVAKSIDARYTKAKLTASPPIPNWSNVSRPRHEEKLASSPATPSSSTPPAASTSTKSSWPKWSN